MFQRSYMKNHILIDFSYKQLIIFRVLRYVSTSANFETTEIKNSNRFLMWGCGDLQVHMLRGRGNLKTYKNIQGGWESKNQ